MQETVRVVRDGRGDVEGLHGGHFSRLWSEDAWATLRQEENLDEDAQTDVGRDGDDRLALIQNAILIISDHH